MFRRAQRVERSEFLCLWLCASLRERTVFGVTCTTRQRQSRWTALVRHVTLLSILQYLPLHHTHHPPLSTDLQLSAFYSSTLLLFYSPLLPAILPEPRAPVTDTRLSAYPFLFIAILPSCRGRVDQICYFHYSISSSLDFPCLLFQTLFIPLIFTSPGHLYHLQLIN